MNPKLCRGLLHFSNPCRTSGLRRWCAGLAAALGLAAVEPGLASPASPHSVSLPQPDGTAVTLHVRGDEFSHWLEDGKGFTVVTDKAGRHVYAKKGEGGSLVPTALAIGSVVPEQAGLTWGVRPAAGVRESRRAAMAAQGPEGPQRIAPVGTVRNLVILCRFSDHTAAHGRTQAEYDTLFNAVGGHATLAPTGSVRDYFTEVSYGILTLQSTVVAWVTLPQTEAYYAAGNDGFGSYPQNAQRMTEDALNLADPLVNFTQFDQDNDGFVDAIDIVHSGYGGETGGGGGNWIWSHKWSLPSNWTSAENNGSGVRVKVRDYHSEPALWETSGTGILRIGVVCHETGHFFGLPDLYDTSGGGSGIGSYCLMANSWGFDGTQQHPPHPSAWCRVQLGWVTPTVISTGDFSAPRAETSNTVFKITAGYPATEYLLVENRQPFGFEDVMPQGGLCIWHIDEAKSANTDEGYPGQFGWPANNQHYKVALLQADGAYDLEHGNNRGDAGDVYRTGGVAAINDSTVPGTNRYQSGTVAPSGNRIESISAPGTTMTFSLNPIPTSSPVITSALTAAATTGAVFSYQITATNAPTSYSASGYPAGLSFSTATGILSGTPTTTGTFNVALGATNGIGTGTATLVLTSSDISAGIASALETPGRLYSFTGQASWFPQSGTTFDGVDAAQSGDIGDGGSSVLETTVTGPVNVTFQARISSESGFDYLRFSVDGAELSALSGEQGWAAQTHPIASGSHVLRWSYTKDSSVSSGSDAAWVDNLVIASVTTPPVVTSAATAEGFTGGAFSYQITATNSPGSYGASGLPAWLTVNTSSGLVTGTPPATGVSTFTVSATNTFGTGARSVTLTVTDPNTSLAEALDSPGLLFTSAGLTPWSRQTAVTYDGSDAAVSGPIGHSSSSVMQTTINGPGAISFAWKVSSESGWDFLTFSVDGLSQVAISGEADWTISSHNLTAGSHTLRWTYSKDSSVVSGQDRAWVDRLSANVPVITSPLTATGQEGQSFVYQITATGSPASYGATGLPAGLNVVPATGIINGTPSVQGIFNVNLSATNTFGTGSAQLQLVVNPASGGRQILTGWGHQWQCFHPMGVLPVATGNFDTAWFLSEAAFASTYTGPPFGSVPAVFGDPFIADTFDSFSGPGPVGYGAITYFDSVGSEIPGMVSFLSTPESGNRRTAYFRTTFTVTGATLINPLLRYVMDDGGFIYLDGQLICAVNMPAGATDTYGQLASGFVNTEELIYTVNPAVAGPVAGGNAVIVQPVTSLSAGLHTLTVSLRSNNTASTDLALALELSAASGAPAPDIAVLGGPAGNVSIASGDASPSLTDGTDFGNRSTAGGPFDVPFNLANAGSSALNVGTITSSGAQFSILPGYATLVPAGGSTPVVIRFTPVIGSFSSLITVPSDDPDESPFTFTVTAIGSTGGGRQTLVPWNHSWKYFHPMGALPAAPGNFLTTWFAAESTFLSTYTGPPFGAVPAVNGTTAVTTSYDSGIGNGPLGYDFITYFSSGGAEFTAFGRTLTQPLSGNRRTAYFRTSFTVPAGGLTRTRLRYLMDDGGIIYLDGSLLCTVNMAAGLADTYTQLAAGVTETETILRTVELNTPGAVPGGNAVVNSALGFLSPGTHTLAVSLRSNVTSSTDLCLALELTAEPGCAINAAATNVLRHDNGNTDSDDDTLSFTLTATGLNTGSGWTSAAPAAAGFYGAPVNVTGVPVPAGTGPLQFTLTDNADPACTALVSIPVPPVIGRNLITGGNFFLEGRSTAAGIDYNEAAPWLSIRNASLATQTQLLDFSAVSGPVLLDFYLYAQNLSAGTNFETDDILSAELILNPGPAQTVLNLLDPFDRNRNGVLNGFTGTTAEPYDSFIARDELNRTGFASGNNFISGFHILATIPDSVTTARLAFSFINNSSTEHFAFEDAFISTLSDPDTDDDGLDDNWEGMWFGILPITSGSDDPDRDGATNAEEALAGTHPLDAASLLRLLSVTTVGTTQTLLIQTVPGRRYRIETSSTLSPTGWSPTGPVFTATGTTTSRTLTLSPTARRVFVRAAAVFP